jgi:hypothetical protein
MTEKELIKVLKFISDAYPNKFDFPKGTEAATKHMIATWMVFLKEYDYKLAMTVIKKFAVNNPDWPPTAGQAVRAIEEAMLTEEDEISGAEAWKLLMDSIRKYSAFYNPDKVLKNVPDRVARTAQVVGLNAITKSDEADTFMMNRFIKTYEQFKEVDMQRQMLPGNIRKDYEKLKSRPEVEKLANKFKNYALKGEVNDD